MRMHFPHRLSFFALLICGGVACTPGVDGVDDVDGGVVSPANGAFHGVAACPNVVRKIDLSLVQDAGDDDVDGRVFVETNVRYIDGLVDLTLPHVVAGDLVDGELSDGNLTGLILTETVDNRATAADFSLDVSVETSPSGVTTMTGTLSQLDGNNAPVVNCDLALAPTSEPRPEP